MNSYEASYEINYQFELSDEDKSNILNFRHVHKRIVEKLNQAKLTVQLTTLKEVSGINIIAGNMFDDH